MREVVDAMLLQAARFLKRDCCCCCCCCGGGPKPTFAWVANRMDSNGLSFFHSVIWDKINPGLGWRYRRQHEMVMVSHRDGGKLSWRDNDFAIPNIIKMSAPKKEWHPNQKPIELIELFILAHTKPNDLIIDPFCGSGTTALACHKTGRRFICIDKEQSYIDKAKRRYQELIAQGDLFTKEQPKDLEQLELL
jgi:site-specific DNA-methyltransferase (adenine-specific)